MTGKELSLMSDELEEIRKRKALEMLKGLEEGDQEVIDVLPWAFRFNKNTNFFEILQGMNLVAVTQDERFADTVTNILNRMLLAREAGLVPEEEE
jgi:hypothetical protein